MRCLIRNKRRNERERGKNKRFLGGCEYQCYKTECRHRFVNEKILDINNNNNKDGTVTKIVIWLKHEQKQNDGRTR
jgi:hypothetical protein